MRLGFSYRKTYITFNLYENTSSLLFFNRRPQQYDYTSGSLKTAQQFPTRIRSMILGTTLSESLFIFHDSKHHGLQDIMQLDYFNADLSHT